MNKKLRFLLLAATLLIAGVEMTKASDNIEFDSEKSAVNFMALSSAPSHISIKSLAWADGDWYIHYAGEWSTVYLKIDGKDSQKFSLFKYRTNHDANDTHVQLDTTKFDKSWAAAGFKLNHLKVMDASGSWIDLTDGADHHIDDGKKMPKDGVCRFIQVDWSPGDSFEKKHVEIWVDVYDARDYATDPGWHTYKMGEFTGPTPEQRPQLFTPIFYPRDRYGQPVYGQAGINFTVFQRTFSYHTSYEDESAPWHTYNAQSGIYLRPMLDTIQPNFYMTFEVAYQNDTTDLIHYTTNTVSIPAYHQIHNFHAEEYTDSLGINRGHNRLTWELHHVEYQDIQPSDMFEIQRAYKRDFSDARQVAAVPFHPYYGEANPNPDSTFSRRDDAYEYMDTVPGARRSVNDTVYYRIRRVSAAVWPWQCPDTTVTMRYADSAMVVKRAYVPAIVSLQNTVTKGDNYDRDYGVDLNIHLLTDSGGYWGGSGARLVIEREEVELQLKSRLYVPDDSIRLDPNDPQKRLWIAHYVDHVVRSCTHYNYRAIIDTTSLQLNLPREDYTYTLADQLYTVNSAAQADTGLLVASLPQDSLFFHHKAPVAESFTASQEQYANRIAVSWSVPGASELFFSLERKGAGSWEYIFQQKQGVIHYVDSVFPGEQYDYRLTVHSTCNGQAYNTSSTTTGSAGKYGSVDGYIRYMDGTAIKNVTIDATLNNEPYRTVTTDSVGHYLIDSVYCVSAAQLKIHPTSQYGSFVSVGSGEPDVIVLVNGDEPDVHNVNFVDTNSVEFSGRVLYDLSTVPVRGAHFRINGDTLYDRSHNMVETDQTGSFSFFVPRSAPITIQVFKEGHTFKNDGFFLINERDTFALTKTTPGMRMWDDTKVRLVGRIAGGNVQGTKPLRQALSTNNLGETISMVLELEGDNISHLVHSIDNKLQTIDTTLQHPVKGHTHAHWDPYRITIYPDSLTGEYEVDLFPVKYKVTQLNATGYPTLFNQGQTVMTMDLSASKNLLDSFVHIYHSPVKATIVQTENGITPLSYYGQKQMMLEDMLGGQKTINIVDESHPYSMYLFGYPVFMENYQYNMEVSAHEDYYYNNDPKSGTLDQVMLGNHRARLYNGLVGETAVEDLYLDANGKASISLLVKNTTFSLTEEDALRTVNVSVEVDGEYVEAAALRCFATGSRSKVGEYIQTLGTDIIITDVINDPYGANSYAYLEEGSTYSVNWNWTLNFKAGVEIDIIGGESNTQFVGITSPAGPMQGQVMTINSIATLPIPVVFQWHWSHNYNYAFRTNKRYETSRDIYHVGANADLYIGKEAITTITTEETFRMIDEQAYQRVLPAIRANKVRVVSSGTTADGTKLYLVIGDQLKFNSDIARDNNTFAYTQEHIVRTIIPELKRKRDALLTIDNTSTADSVWQQRADTLGYNLYVTTLTPDSANWGKDNTYTFYKSAKTTFASDEVHGFNNNLISWESAITLNETRKQNVLNREDLRTTYDISSNVVFSNSETTEYSKQEASSFTGVQFDPNAALRNGSNTSQFAEIEKVLNKYRTPPAQNNQNNNNQANNQQNQRQTEAKGSGFACSVTTNLLADIDWQQDNPVINAGSRTVGYVLDAGDGNYLSQNVFRVQDSLSLSDTNYKEVKDDVNTEHTSNKIENKHLPVDFVYQVVGGATKCPYIGADSAIYSKVQLSAPTLRIENPTLAINTHEISNVPENGAAVFSLRLANESEVDPDTYTGISFFKLLWEEHSNPNGVTILMDGLPIADGRSFILQPGEVINKTIEVYRGQGYDFEDLKLQLRSECYSGTYAECSFSVHYMPSSSNVHLSSPTDKWVMNTLSPRDSMGYYIPILIDGYDLNHPNLDHIEFQYKLTTDPDEKWVNQCSYYVDQDHYDLASGNKEMIHEGRISTRFYGERDPMEQRYDLRAVTFTRHGSGFVSKSSAVLSGIKDTRVPTLFGLPTPADQILTFDKFIEIPFSEPIAYNYLDEDNNFEMLGVINAGTMTSGTSLSFPGEDGSLAKSVVRRSLKQKSFTIDLMVRPANPHRAQTFFAHGAADNLVSFGMTNDGRLTAKVGTTLGVQTFVSEPLEEMDDFTRVIFTYNAADSTVHFYGGTKDFTSTKSSNACVITADKDYYYFGGPGDGGDDDLRPFEGRMLEARVWSKALNADEIVTYNQRRLTGYEECLVAYYPMNDARGDIAKDKANGANLECSGLTWLNPEGMALHIDSTFHHGEGVMLSSQAFSRTALQDLTLGFWFKCDQKPLDKDTMTLFATGRGSSDEDGAEARLFIGLEGNRLMIRQNGDSIACGSINDADWHRFALTLRRSNNMGNVFLDGVLTTQFNAHRIGDIAGIPFIGACHYVDTCTAEHHRYIRYPFAGHFDQLQLWNQALSLEFQNRFSDAAPQGTEMGLAVYLPFHTTRDNGYGHYELFYSPFNLVKNINGEQDSIVLGEDVYTLAEKQIYAPVRQDDQLSKLKFSWVGQDSRLVINIDMQDKELNKNTIYMTVRDVKDLNGNPMMSPLSWNMFVDKNRLRWADRMIDIELPYGQDTVFTETVYNKCGAYTGYTISSMASWLEPVTDQGYLSAADESRVSLRINSSCDPGEYSAFVYLTDQNGLAEPLMVNLHVFVEKPHWEVNREKYPQTMSLVGQVRIKENGEQGLDTDEEDIIAAFIGQECVATQHNSYRGGNSAVYMTIYGSQEVQDQPLTFKLWRAKTGRTYDLNPSVSDIKFAINTCYGCDGRPVIFSTLIANEIQTLHTQRGWNWIGFNVELPDNATPNNVLLGNENLSSGDQIKSLVGFYMAEYSNNGGQPSWVVANSNGTLDHRHCYSMYSENGGDIYVQGSKLSSDQMCTLLDTGWVDLPYWSSYTQTVTEAMADYLDHARVGELIKGYREFAVYTANQRWEGSLEYMRPGEGYEMHRLSQEKVDFCYANVQAVHAPVQHQTATPGAGLTATSMPMIIRVADEVELHNGDQLLITNPHTHATISAPAADTWWGVVYGNPGDQIEFAIERDGHVVMTATEHIDYDSHTLIGEPQAPHLLHFHTSDVEKVIYQDHLYIIRDGEWYNASGAKVK